MRRRGGGAGERRVRRKQMAQELSSTIQWCVSLEHGLWKVSNCNFLSNNFTQPANARTISSDSNDFSRSTASSSRPAGRPVSNYETSSARSFSYPSQAMHPSALFPTTATSQAPHAPSTPTGQINSGKGHDYFSSSTVDEPSPVYSLDAVSVSDDTTDFGDVATRKSQLPEEVPHRFESTAMQQRRSVGAAASAPSSAVGTWTVASENDVVGLGFDYDAKAGSSSNDRRTSTSSTSTSNRRASTGRSYSMDGKTAAKTHRRQSASKSGFAHLPPSPAASSVAQAFAASTSSAPSLPEPPSFSSQLPPSPAAPQTPSASTPGNPISTGRTPDMARLSHHSHHSSPSVIAASILRQTRDLEPGVDMDTAAAADEGTAEALRKLDGLSSPRMSRVYSSGTGVVPGTGSRSRTTSRSGDPGTPPAALARHDSTESKTKRRTRSSTGGSVGALPKEIESAMLGGTEGRSSSSRSQQPLSLSVGGSPAAPAVPSPTFLSGASTVQLPRSPLSPSMNTPGHASPSAGRTPSQTRPTSGATFDVPFPTTSSPFKRASSSSTNLTAGTSTSLSGSHDSTSGMSFSNSSFATTVARSSSFKNRRGSVSSDMSSTQSVGEGSALRAELSDSAGEGELARDIPPVPPIPKDWETYRPSPSAASTSSAQNSPRFDAPRFDAGSRRPSEASSYAESTTLLSPRAAEMEPSLSSNSISSLGRAPRKWSISNAFSKSRSPKPSSSVKESSSYTDLLEASQRDRKTSFGSHMSEPGFPRRMAASTNDIVGLANGTDSSSMRSLGRSSIRSDKHASTIARARTSSQSSSSTARTSTTAAPLTSVSMAATPSVVTTSPGRSRSSLLSPRRTPSGIPFFSRKSSTGSVTTPSPNPEKEKHDSSPPDEKSGRKSILGLNFLRNSTSRRGDKDKAPPSPVFKRQTMSSVPVTKPDTRIADEFGRRASVAAKTSSLMATRKRGKVRFILIQTLALYQRR